MILLGSLAEFPVCGQGVGKTHMRISIVRMRGDFRAIFCDGLGNLPGGFFQRADVHVDPGKVRAQAQHFPILFQGLVDFLLRGISISEIVMRFHIARLEGQGLLVRSNRLIPIVQTRRFVALLEVILRGRRGGLGGNGRVVSGGGWGPGSLRYHGAKVQQQEGGENGPQEHSLPLAALHRARPSGSHSHRIHPMVSSCAAGGVGS